MTAISFIPAIYRDPLPILNQIALRLFPFERGLVHDYMASNFWAIYMIGYKIKLAVPILYERIVTKVKSKPLSFHITDFAYYKKLSMTTTVIFLLPLVAKMW